MVTAIKSMVQTVQWAVRQPIPSEYKALMAYLSTFSGVDNDVIYPGTKRIASETGIDEVRVEWMLRELADTGLITLDGTDIHLHRKVELDRSNPLMTLMLREKLHHIPDLTYGERWVCDYIARMYSWDRNRAPVHYEQACRIYPMFDAGGRRAWKHLLHRLTLKRVLRVVDVASNQHESSEYAFTDDFLLRCDKAADPKMGSPEFGADPKMGSPEFGADPKMGSPEFGADPKMGSPEFGADPKMGSPEFGADPKMGSPTPSPPYKGTTKNHQGTVSVPIIEQDSWEAAAARADAIERREQADRERGET